MLRLRTLVKRPFFSMPILRGSSGQPTPIPGFRNPDEVATNWEISTGAERYEYLKQLQGQDPWEDLNPIILSEPGTVKKPILVTGVDPERYIGCTGFPADSHEVVWLTLRPRDKGVDRCPHCGNAFKVMYNSLLLAGGYGTRFQKQVPPDSPLSKLPKGLLPLNGKSLLSRWMETGIENVYIITNDLYLQVYQQSSKVVKAIASNGSTKNEDRLGSVGDLQLAIHEFNFYGQDLLVIASDIYFLGFEFKRFIDYCLQTQVVVVLYYKIKDENVCKSGIIELDSDSLVTRFLEKPSLKDTESRLGCPCFYYFPSSSLGLIDEFMQETRGDLAKVDASGKLIQWLIGKTRIQGYPLKYPKLDIGDYQSYLDANDLLSKHEKSI